MFLLFFFPSINLPCQAVARIPNKNIYVNSCCKEKTHVKCLATIHKARAPRRAQYQWFSSSRDGFCPQGQMAALGDIPSVPTGRLSLVSSGQRPGVMLNILQSTGQRHTAKHDLVQRVASVEDEKSALHRKKASVEIDSNVPIAANSKS